MSDEPDDQEGFWDRGPAGWVYPAAFELALLATWVSDVFFGSDRAHAFLRDYGVAAGVLIQILVGGLLGYHGFKHRTTTRFGGPK